MKNTGTLKVTTPTDTTILLERVFSASRALVWRTLTEPALVMQWYGPRGHEMVTCEIDLRVGGRWRYVTRMPNGHTLGQGGEYRELVPPDRIVTTESMDGYEGSILVTYTLVERDGATTLQCLSECGIKEVRDMIIATGMEHGAAETYDRLAELLHTQVQGAIAQ